MPFPKIVVRYEDLKVDSGEFLKQLCEATELQKIDSEIAAAVAKSTFDAMRAMEERELAQGKRGTFLEMANTVRRRGLRFMNRGEIGGYREVLAPGEIDAALARFGPWMERLGYTEGLEHRPLEVVPRVERGEGTPRAALGRGNAS